MNIKVLGLSSVFLLYKTRRAHAYISPMIDPFDANETSPLLTNALSSSLWELAAHQNHYLTSISTLSKIFSAPFTKMPYAMEEFLDHTYATVRRK